MKVVQVFLFIIVFSFCGNIQAANSNPSFPGIFAVDYKLLFLLHPFMVDFDLLVGRHLRSDVNLKDGKVLEKLSKEIASLNSGAKKKVEDIQRHIDSCYREIEKLEKERKSAFEGPVNSSASSPILKIDSEIRERNLQIDRFKKKQTEITDSVFDPMYISRAESQNRINAALMQIDATLNKFSQAKEGALIVDSNYIRCPNTYNNFHPAPEACFNFLSIGLKQDLLEFNPSPGDMGEKMRANYLKPEMQKVFSEIIGKDFQKKLEETMNKTSYFNTAFATTLTKYPGIAPILGTKGRLFLAGGNNIDISKEILAEIFKINKVREEIADKILNLLPVN